MVKRILLALALLMPAVVQAQTFPKPPDVPAYVEVVPVWESDKLTANVTLDPNTTPPTAVELADYPSTITDQLNTGGIADGGFQLTNADGGSAVEAKFRTHANCTKIAYTDPIRNYGQQNASHLHQFFGNVHINDFSTYQSLRTQRRSLAGGGDVNGTGYWFPAPIRNVSGTNYSPKCKYAVIYYFVAPSQGRTTVDLFRGLRYVSGVDMDDPNKAWLQAHIDAANAASTAAGYSGGNRYALKNPISGLESNGFKWKCETTGSGTGTGNSFGQLKNADGTDPWGGRCQAGDDLALTSEASNCWDGKNLWSPGGYKHVIQAIHDKEAGGAGFVCPKNYYRLPILLITIWFEHDGPSDYMNWRLSSDDMYQAKLTQVGTPRTVLNGESAHFDWMNGWDGTRLDSWLRNCIGAQNGTPHECGDGRISLTDSLKRGETVHVFGSSTSRTPQVTIPTVGPTISTAAGRFTVPANPNGPVTVRVHGN